MVNNVFFASNLNVICCSLCPLPQGDSRIIFVTVRDSNWILHQLEAEQTHFSQPFFLFCLLQPLLAPPLLFAILSPVCQWDSRLESTQEQTWPEKCQRAKISSPPLLATKAVYFKKQQLFSYRFEKVIINLTKAKYPKLTFKRYADLDSLLLTLSIPGTSLQMTSTFSGGSPTSSLASRRAVSISSLSFSSLLPPGKHTSPGDLLS